MFNLKNVLAAKIGITFILWVIPLLASPLCFLECLGFPTPNPEIFVRLLGIAYLALVVGYIFGYLKEKSGVYPRETVLIGIVSNGGATAALTVALITGSWATWGYAAQVYMWISLLCVSIIFVSLLLLGPYHKSRRNKHVKSDVSKDSAKP